jgi:hypothetical protein
MFNFVLEIILANGSKLKRQDQNQWSVVSGQWSENNWQLAAGDWQLDKGL